MMDKTAVITLCCIVVLLVCAGALTYYFKVTPNDDSNSDASRTLGFLEGSFTDLAGNPVSFEAYEGKVRVVNSFASWTPFSASELPLLESLAAEYKDTEVVFIAINRGESKDLTSYFISTLGTLENILFVLDPQDVFYTSIEGYAMPETVIYDARGDLFFHKRGNMNASEMREFVEKALQISE